jgi:hypothetical protein
MKDLAPLVGFIACTVACAVACGSDDSNGDGASSSSSTSSGGSSGFGGSSSGATSGNPPVDAGGGCTIEAIGFDEGTVVQSLQRASEGDGGVKWTDLDNAKALDGSFAKVVLAAGEESEELRITGFSFKLPAGSVFQGVDVRLDRQAPEGGIVDGFIALVGVKNQASKGKFIATAWPTTIVGTHHYAQATDTWGMDLNPPDVETVDFGVGIWVKRDPNDAGPANATASVDAMRIRVHYCPP